MSDFEDYKNELAAHEKAGEAIRKKGQRIFEKAAKAFFENNPNLKSFSWPQYTPYWCDGDACEFSVEAYPESIGIEEEVEDKEGLQSELSDLIYSLDEETMEEYGEGLIVVGSDGTVTVEDYDHD